MLLPIAELIALVSRYAALAPGDVVLTGTPAGTGDEVARYLVDGDVVEVDVAGLPALVSTVAAGALDDASRPQRMRRSAS
jgi:2-keto-4-pentenoate hydratase/2-oxohepta-3-ene-1,7-dioic acid hydratase in catechol pathway